MNITLYTTGCPKCKVLEKKLNAAGIQYTTNTDTEEMTSKGFTQVPILEVGDIYLPFKDANDWINSQGGNKE